MRLYEFIFSPFLSKSDKKFLEKMGVILYFLSPLLPFSLKKTQRHSTFILSPRKTAKK